VPVSREFVCRDRFDSDCVRQFVGLELVRDAITSPHRTLQYRAGRHPTTVASIGLVLSGAYHAPSRHSQRKGSRYVPL
jgi:hypothetical protein